MSPPKRYNINLSLRIAAETIAAATLLDKNGFPMVQALLLALLNVCMSAKAPSCSKLHASLLCYGTLQKKHVNVRQKAWPRFNLQVWPS